MEERQTNQIGRERDMIVSENPVGEHFPAKSRTMKTRLLAKIKLLSGTPRRLIWNICRPRYVRESLAQRTGACLRCGACCRLVWRCAFFYEDKGVPSCRLYAYYRPANCSNFPIDRLDIADRDMVSPSRLCGFVHRDQTKGSDCRG